jgi:ABC-type glycerol-3-phosphate transport system permease component
MAMRTSKAANNRRWLTPSRLRAIIISLILVPICILWIYPFLWMVSAALKTNAEIFQGLNLIPQSPQWGNFSRAWTEARIGRYFVNTVVVTLSSTAIVLVSTAMLGYVLGRYDFLGKRLVAALFVATVFLPQGYTIIPVFELIGALGLRESLWGLILGEAGGTPVIFILLFAGYFSQLPRELEEAAIVDGAGFLRVFWQIMLPLAKPVMATVIIMQVIATWNSFLLPLVLTLSRPDLRTLAVGIYAFRGEYFIDWSGMAAAATISIVPIVVIFLFLQRYFVEGIAGSVKQ